MVFDYIYIYIYIYIYYVVLHEIYVYIFFIRGLGRRIVEVEKELNLAKRQGYLEG